MNNFRNKKLLNRFFAFFPFFFCRERFLFQNFYLLASLANTPNLKYCDEGDIEVVNDYLDTVADDERNVAIAELREKASNEYYIKMKSWLDNVIERIESNVLGGQGLTR